MGRRSSAATVAGGVDSSPSSAETSFRELDDVFLQTQTRIWLGEVLKIRLDELVSISDLLADGELLFEVSKTVWSLLLEKCVELRRIKAHQSPLGSRKSSRRYKPYCNVDSFIKVCKILGLNGIDLFSPSDVVEKRNTRKVCICIRAISKKARSKHLNVPDFDLVTHAVVMPTDMVGCIRRSLESSQCSVSSCSSSNSYKLTNLRNQQTKLTSSPNGNYDSCSEESDEAESAYFGMEPYSSLTEKSDHLATLNLDAENSPGCFSAVKHYTTRQVSLQSDMRNYYRNGKPHFLQHSGNDYRANNLSTCYFKARGDLHINNNIRDSFETMSELAEVDIALGNDDLEVGDSISDNISGSDFISDYLAFSDSVILRNNGTSSLSSDGEDNFCNFFMGINSHGLDSIQRTSPDGFHHRPLDDLEDVEVSSTASMSSILGRVLNLDFDDQYNGRDSSMVKVHSIIELFEKGTYSQEKCSIMEDQTQASSQYDILSQCSTTDIEESQSAIQLENEGNCSKFLLYHEINGRPYCRESQKLDICGYSQVPGITFSTETMDRSLAENEKSSKTMDLKNAVIGVSDINPNLEQNSSNHGSMNSLHHKMCMEAKVSCHKGLLEGNQSHICSLGYEDVSIENVMYPESHEPENGTIVSPNITSPANECESMAEKCPIPFGENGKIITGGVHQTYTGSSRSTHHFSNRTEDFQNENIVDISSENVLDNQNQRCVARQDKPRRKSLLSTVVTGTTLVGALLFLLHIRKGKEQTDKSQESPKAPRFRGAKSASQRGQSSRSNGTYPAEKLKFGN